MDPGRNKILDSQLVQVSDLYYLFVINYFWKLLFITSQSNNCGGSYCIEKAGLVRSVQKMREETLNISVIATDQHK